MSASALSSTAVKSPPTTTYLTYVVPPSSILDVSLKGLYGLWMAYGYAEDVDDTLQCIGVCVFPTNIDAEGYRVVQVIDDVVIGSTPVISISGSTVLRFHNINPTHSVNAVVQKISV